MSNRILEQVYQKVKRLSNDEQRQVLDFMKTFEQSTRRGTPGARLTRFAGAIQADDLQLIQEAIESGCEQIDGNEW